MKLNTKYRQCLHYAFIVVTQNKTRYKGFKVTRNIALNSFSSRRAPVH